MPILDMKAENQETADLDKLFYKISDHMDVTDRFKEETKHDYQP